MALPGAATRVSQAQLPHVHPLKRSNSLSRIHRMRRLSTPSMVTSALSWDRGTNSSTRKNKHNSKNSRFGGSLDDTHSLLESGWESCEDLIKGFANVVDSVRSASAVTKSLSSHFNPFKMGRSVSLPEFPVLGKSLNMTISRAKATHARDCSLIEAEVRVFDTKEKDVDAAWNLLAPSSDKALGKALAAGDWTFVGRKDINMIAKRRFIELEDRWKLVRAKSAYSHERHVVSKNQEPEPPQIDHDPGPSGFKRNRTFVLRSSGDRILGWRAHLTQPARQFEVEEEMWYFENDAGKWSRAGVDTDGLSMLSTSKERTQWGFEDPENMMNFHSSERLNEELTRLLQEAQAMEREFKDTEASLVKLYAALQENQLEVEKQIKEQEALEKSNTSSSESQNISGSFFSEDEVFSVLDNQVDIHGEGDVHKLARTQDLLDLLELLELEKEAMKTELELLNLESSSVAAQLNHAEPLDTLPPVLAPPQLADNGSRLSNGAANEIEMHSNPAQHDPWKEQESKQLEGLELCTLEELLSVNGAQQAEGWQEAQEAIREFNTAVRFALESNSADHVVEVHNTIKPVVEIASSSQECSDSYLSRVPVVPKIHSVKLVWESQSGRMPKKVGVMGDFSSWEVIPLNESCENEGQFELVCPLRAGNIGSMDFVIDGRYLRRVGPIFVDRDMTIQAKMLGVAA